MNRIPRTTLFLSLAALAVYLIPGAAEFLQYDRAAIAHGQLWRLVTGHWTHWNGDQFFWNVLPFAVLGALCERRDPKRFLCCLISAALAVPAAVWLVAPQLHFYRGLSGLDSAFFALLGAHVFQEKMNDHRWAMASAILVLWIGFLAKVAFEASQGATLFVTHADGMAPVAAAHLAGAATGALSFVLYGAVGKGAQGPLALVLSRAAHFFQTSLL